MSRGLVELRGRRIGSGFGLSSLLRRFKTKTQGNGHSKRFKKELHFILILEERFML
jgi:hypothetical protein